MGIGRVGRRLDAVGVCRERCWRLDWVLDLDIRAYFDSVPHDLMLNAMFRVQLDNGHEVLGYVAGKMRRYRIRILPGDRVRVEVSPYDVNRGRIVYRDR